MIAGVRGKDLDDARSLGVSDVLAIDDDKAIEKFRLVDAIADTVGGEVAVRLIAKVKQSGSFGYTAVLPESAAAQNPDGEDYARGCAARSIQGARVCR